MDEINVIIFVKIQEFGNFEDLLFLEQESCKDDFIDWFEDYDIDQVEDLVDIFVEFCLVEDDLDQMSDILSQEVLGFVL